MSTRHRSRMDGSVCPDARSCARWHGSIESGLVVGDTCECCGQDVRPLPEWKPVHAHAGDRGHIVYWRLVADDGRLLGAVRQQADRQWSALRYGPDRRVPSRGLRQLGEHRTWQRARRAVEDDVTDTP